MTHSSSSTAAAAALVVTLAAATMTAKVGGIQDGAADAPNDRRRFRLESRSFRRPLDQILLQDAFPPSSPLCGESPSSDDSTAATTRTTNTKLSFEFTSTWNSSQWSSANGAQEKYVYLAEMRHDDEKGPNRTWTARFGTGGNIYSFVGPFGESIPPQTSVGSPWIDEVLQCVAVDQTKNSVEEDMLYFIHQAGAYDLDKPYMPPPFSSPTVAMHCEGSECRFASWGTQAHVPTAFKSDLLYLHRYRDCGNGVLEYTQGFQNIGDIVEGDVLTYLNVPWGGVRTSNLPEVLLSDRDGRILDKELPLQLFRENVKAPNLNSMGGFTTFATVLPVPDAKKTLSLPCFRYSPNDAAVVEVKDPCSESDVQLEGYVRFALIFDGPNPCAVFAPHAERFGGNYLRCSIQGGYGGVEIPRIDGCRQCDGQLRFTNVRTGASFVVTDVVHWSYGDGGTFFLSPNATAEEINAMFSGDDTDGNIAVTYDDVGREEDSFALAYVHGIDREFEDPGNDWFIAPGRIRFGRAFRDYTVFTVNARVKLEPGSTYFNRQYLITDRFADMEAHANEWVDETFADMLTGYDFGGGRRVEMWQDKDTVGIAFAEYFGVFSTTCVRGRSKCIGSSVPLPGMIPFFAITCGDGDSRSSYVGPDRYALAPEKNSTAVNAPIRSYVCDGEDDPTMRPTWTLLGYFPHLVDGCDGVMGAQYDPNMCGGTVVSAESNNSTEESKRDTAEPTSMPTVKTEGGNIFGHSVKSNSPSAVPMCDSPWISTSTDDQFDQASCQQPSGAQNISVVVALILGNNASLTSSEILNASNNSILADVMTALRSAFVTEILKETHRRFFLDADGSEMGVYTNETAFADGNLTAEAQSALETVTSTSPNDGNLDSGGFVKEAYSWNETSIADRNGNAMIEPVPAPALEHANSVSVADGRESVRRVQDERDLQGVRRFRQEIAVRSGRQLIVLYRSDPVVVGVSDIECPVETPGGLLCQRIEAAIVVTVLDEDVTNSAERIEKSFTDFVESGRFSAAMKDSNLGEASIVAFVAADSVTVSAGAPTPATTASPVMLALSPTPSEASTPSTLLSIHPSINISPNGHPSRKLTMAPNAPSGVPASAAAGRAKYTGENSLCALFSFLVGTALTVSILA